MDQSPGSEISLGSLRPPTPLQIDEVPPSSSASGRVHSLPKKEPTTISRSNEKATITLFEGLTRVAKPSKKHARLTIKVVVYLSTIRTSVISTVRSRIFVANSAVSPASTSPPKTRRVVLNESYLLSATSLWQPKLPK